MRAIKILIDDLSGAINRVVKEHYKPYLLSLLDNIEKWINLHESIFEHDIYKEDANQGNIAQWELFHDMIMKGDLR